MLCTHPEVIALRKLLLLAFVLIFAFVLVNRQRVFVRDPIAKVTVNGTPDSAYQVYINYSNDVLLERDDQKTGYGILVQNWNRTPGTPSTLNCIHWMACMTDADHATTLPLDHTGPGAYDPRTTMSSTAVSFVDGEGRAVNVALR
jgi:hypothetical protein